MSTLWPEKTGVCCPSMSVWADALGLRQKMQGGERGVGPLSWVSPQNQGHLQREAGMEAGAGWTSGIHQAALLSRRHPRQSVAVVMGRISGGPGMLVPQPLLLLSSLCCPSSAQSQSASLSNSLCGA